MWIVSFTRVIYWSIICFFVGHDWCELSDPSLLPNTHMCMRCIKFKKRKTFKDLV